MHYMLIAIFFEFFIFGNGWLSLISLSDHIWLAHLRAIYTNKTWQPVTLRSKTYYSILNYYFTIFSHKYQHFHYYQWRMHRLQHAWRDWQLIKYKHLTRYPWGTRKLSYQPYLNSKHYSYIYALKSYFLTININFS